jgi:hypothetical protein
LENCCASLVVQVLKTGTVLQWNNQRVPLKRKQGHDMVILKKNVSGSVTGNY